MTHHLYPFLDERSYFFDSMYDHNRLCHGSKTFFRQPDKDQVKLESMFTKIQVLRTSAVGNAWCRGSLCVLRCKVTCHGMASWQHPSLSPSGPRLLWRRGYQHQMPSAVVLLLCCWLDHLHAAANASVHCSAGQRCPSVAVLCTLDHIRLKLSQTHFYVHQNILHV